MFFVFIISRIIKKRSKLTIATLPILKNLIILYCCSSNNTNRKLNKVFGGVTRDEIYGVLKQISNKKLNSKFLNSVNLIMISNNLPLNTNFKKYVESNCRIESYSNNSLQESNRINNIIEKLSSDNLNNIIHESILKTDGIKCSSSFYFKTNWTISFPRKNTTMKLFMNYNKQKLIPMMRINNFHSNYYSDNNYKLLELSCIDNIVMGFVLPQNKSPPSLTWERLGRYIDNLRNIRLNVIQIPKFKDHCRFKINNIFRKMGIGFIFDEIEIPSLVNTNKKLKINEYVHEVSIEVDEGVNENYQNNDGYKGSENLNFIADHPFIYYLRHKNSNIIMMMGVFK